MNCSLIKPLRGRSDIPWEVRFWLCVEKTGDCWWWRGYTEGAGYGAIRINGRRESAHRVSWIMSNGPIRSNLWVLHKCDNPLCVNPDHLFLGTCADNVRDMISKGRQMLKRRSPAGSHAGGRSFLKVDDVVTILKLSQAGVPRAKIASRHNVKRHVVDMILRGVTWSWLTGIKYSPPKREAAQ